MLQLEKKLFDYFNQEVFRDDNGTAVSSVVARMTLCHLRSLRWQGTECGGLGLAGCVSRFL